MTADTTPMVLNHLSFPSRDVVATAAFFERQLECHVTPLGASYVAKRPGFDIVIEDASERTARGPKTSTSASNSTASKRCATRIDGSPRKASR